MGALETTGDPVAKLIGQVNRFGPDAPVGLRFVATPYPLATGNIPPAVAVSAVQILYARARDAVLKFGDKGSIDLMKAAEAGLKDPVGYVTKNLEAVTNQLAIFGDAAGLGASKISVVGKVADMLKSPLALAALGGGLLLFWVTTRKGTR